ncbi:pseudouridine synthase [Staphylococcus chromogenes]|uniref:pseudouridine synthase n=1 Tax=Staphylococcus chromogenes TaxID=46126 RepID=UPI000D023463|nr:pseudouridine synthase [Staphylococcus chromogenes]
MRIDKYLADMGVGSRSEIKTLLKKGEVTLNDHRVKAAKTQINPYEDRITVNQKVIAYEPFVYLMLNKPKGVISATKDDRHSTLIDLIHDYQYLDLFPVGRLDKDTEGLILITNNGKFNHLLMSPQHHVSKTYYVETKHVIEENTINIFKEGVPLKEGKLKPASLEIIESNSAEITITEGKFHQIKRMFHYVNNEVIYLKRLKIAELTLDETLPPGGYRKLTEDDFQRLGLTKKDIESE